MPENQNAWNSDNQGIKEKINQNNQTSKVEHAGQFRKMMARQLRGGADCQGRQSCEGGTDLRGKLRLRVDCGLRLGLLWWEILAD